ncbi:hypothetical protein JCM19241_723 [Vibrio ishigakensis]|uniref:Uncharacterized protein n=1 Tax=Vibrio ishigakensis TaxID=1481914 RepID=A0A0B8QEB9_9VIBR|nr:hypothetical protein JCM19241_723 [Vibrio ishigakensis]
MAAFENNTLITPFSSIAAMSDTKNLDDVAAELGLTVEELTSDYVASNDSKVHLYARTLASQLAYQSTDDQSENLMVVAKKTKELVEKIESEQGTDFDFSTITVDVEVDSEGNVSVDEVPRVSTLSDFLEIKKDDVAQPIYLASLNPSWFAEEDIMGLTFDDGIGADIDDPSDTWTYEIDGLSLTVEGEEFNEFIYVSNNIALGVDLEMQDLGLFGQTALDESGQFSSGELEGKTLFMVADDSTNKTPDPIFVKLSFGESDVTIYEDDSSFSVSYEIDGSGALNINLKDHNPNDNNMQMYKSIENQHLLVGFDTATQAFVLNFYDEAFAKKIYQDWQALAD